MKQSILVYSIVLVLCLSPRLAFGQAEIDTKVLQGGDGRCAPMEERERALNEIRQTVNSLINGTTCGTPGWKRIAFINMTDTSYSCPTGLNLTSYSKRTCGRSHWSTYGCSSTTFDVGGLPYSQVCGRIKGYQFGATHAFKPYLQGIDSYYVSGVSLTHGRSGSREHIWTFAAGLSESDPARIRNRCPCDTASNDRVPSFVGNDYFCESGVNRNWIGFQFIFFPDDPLWDGRNCTDISTCCEFNNPPWFTKTLNAATTDDIELRICNTNRPSVQDIPLELIELYVQ